MELYLIVVGIFVAVYLIAGLVTSYIYYRLMLESYKKEVPSWLSSSKKEIALETLLFPILWVMFIMRSLNKGDKNE